MIHALLSEAPTGTDLACPELGIPSGRRLELPGRGTTWVREHEGPSGARPVVLLHGLGATGGLNWAGAFDHLGQRFRVISVDHRGHGRGIRTRRFRLEDCADDIAALITQLDLRDPLLVGYSMGGPIATLAWRRHPELVGGLVLCATSRNFRGSPAEKLTFAAFAAAGLSSVLLPQRLLFPEQMVRHFGSLFCALPIPLAGKRLKWAVDELAGHEAHAVLQAAAEIGKFNASAWITGIDVPSAVVAHTNDQVVPLRRQLRLAAAIPQAILHEVPAGHAAVAGGPEREAFLDALMEACEEVHVACRKPSSSRGRGSGARFAS